MHIRLSPVPGNFDTSKRITTQIEGFGFDLIFVLGAQSVDDLGQVYRELKGEFEDANIINVDISSMNRRFGVVNVIDVKMDSLSTLVFSNAHEWGLAPDKRAAKAFLTGISYNNTPKG